MTALARRALLALALTTALPAPAAHAGSCTDPSGLCAEGDGVRWKPDGTLSPAQRRKEDKKRKGTGASVDLVIEGGRGSVFIDGRYAGTAPLDNFYLEPGAHDLQVRDGNRILAEGVLTVPSGGDVSLTVKH